MKFVIVSQNPHLYLTNGLGLRQGKKGHEMLVVDHWKGRFWS